MRLEKHPDKTYVGRIEKDFDFLGYHFGPEGLRLAKATLEKFVERATRLNEQERGDQTRSGALGQYVRRWGIWVRSGLGPVDAPHRGAKRRSDFLRLAVGAGPIELLPPRPKGQERRAI